MPPKTIYYCDCTQYCQPGPCRVSKRTYSAHAVHRRSRIQSALDDFIAERNIDPGPLPSDHDEDMPDNDWDVDSEDPHLTNEEMPAHFDMHDSDDFDEIYADAIPPPPPDIEAAQAGDLENLYVDPIPPVNQEDRMPLLENADEVVSFSRLSTFPNYIMLISSSTGPS